MQESPPPASSILDGPALPALGHALAGSTGSAISNICTYPLDLIITRLQTQRQLRKNASSPHEGEYKDISDAAGKIYTQEGGFSGFYTGVLEDTGKTIADSFLFFLAYNFLRQNRQRTRGTPSRSLPVLDELSVGILAGAFAKLITTPIANIVTRKQTSALVSSRSSSGSQSQPTVRNIASQIRSEKGLQGFWSGYSASLLLTLNPSLTFFFYETFKRTLLPRTKRDDPGALATFFLAAVSKAMASTITYPFSLAKARAQTSSKIVDGNDEEVKEGLEKATSGEVSGTRRTRKAARTTVFSTILHIARTEGVGALYEGLSGEVLKGFFSHGITMLLKDVIHKFIIQMYYTVLKWMKRYPSPQELAQQAKERAETIIESASDQASQAAETVSNGTQSVMEKGQEVAQTGSARAQSLYQAGKHQASSLVDAAKTKADDAGKYTSNAASSAYEAGKDTTTGAYDKSKDAVSNVYDKAQGTATGAYDTTRSTASDAYDASKSTTNNTINTTKDASAAAYNKSKDTASSVSDTSRSVTNTALNTTKDTATTTYNKTRGTASSAYDASKSTTNAALDKTKDTATGAYDATKSTTNNAISSAADTKDSLAEYVGKKTENVGRKIRPSVEDAGEE